MPKSVWTALFRPRPLDSRHSSDISLLCRLSYTEGTMSHAEGAGNWAFGPWGVVPVEQLRGMKWHFMKGDPRRKKIEHLERLEALRHLGDDVAFGRGPTWGRGGPFGGGRGRRRNRGDVRAALLLLLAEEARNGYQL